jgi:hypothetical protein
MAIDNKIPECGQSRSFEGPERENPKRKWEATTTSLKASVHISPGVTFEGQSVEEVNGSRDCRGLDQNVAQARFWSTEDWQHFVGIFIDSGEDIAITRSTILAACANK